MATAQKMHKQEADKRVDNLSYTVLFRENSLELEDHHQTMRILGKWHFRTEMKEEEEERKTMQTHLPFRHWVVNNKTEIDECLRHRFG